MYETCRRRKCQAGIDGLKKEGKIIKNEDREILLVLVAYEQSPRLTTRDTATAKINSQPSKPSPHTATLRECHRGILAKAEGQNNEVQASKHVLDKRNMLHAGQEEECLDVGLLHGLAQPVRWCSAACQAWASASAPPPAAMIAPDCLFDFSKPKSTKRRLI